MVEEVGARAGKVPERGGPSLLNQTDKPRSPFPAFPYRNYWHLAMPLIPSLL